MFHFRRHRDQPDPNPNLNPDPNESRTASPWREQPGAHEPSREAPGRGREEWGDDREWTENWRGERAEAVGHGGPWYDQESPAGQEQQAGAPGSGASDAGGPGNPYSQGYGSRRADDRGQATHWREQMQRDRSRRGGEPSYGSGYFGDSERGGQSYGGAQRVYPGDPGYVPQRERERQPHPGERHERQAYPGMQERERPVGPRGYQPPDSRILGDICERLAMNGDVDVHDVSVHVEGGVVRLGGTVSDRREKRRIEEIADCVFGVQEIESYLRVRRESGDAGGMSPGRTLNRS